VQPALFVPAAFLFVMRLQQGMQRAVVLNALRRWLLITGAIKGALQI
jgi:hypothetical protein